MFDLSTAVQSANADYEALLESRIAGLAEARDNAVAGTPRHIANLKLIDAQVALLTLQRRNDPYWELA